MNDDKRYHGSTRAPAGDPRWELGRAAMVLAFLLTSATTSRAQFTDVTSGAMGVAERSRGSAWADYDGDGNLDLFIAKVDQPCRLFRGNGAGAFASLPIPGLLPGDTRLSAAWADMDNDCDLDLLVMGGATGNRLLRNDGAAGFTDIAAGPLVGTGAGYAGIWGDYDLDGDVDLYITNHGGANQLLQNDGSGTFTDVTTGPLGDSGFSIGASWGDYDGDGDLDLYFAKNIYGDKKLLRNDGGAFTDVTTPLLADPALGRGVAWADYDNDGDLDLYVTNYFGSNHLFRNDAGSFVDATSGPLAGVGLGTGMSWGDYDNDGDLDLYLANSGASNQLLRNDGGGVFVDATPAVLAVTGDGTGTSWGDYDNDGDLDLFLANDGQPSRLFRNDLANGNHWIHLDLVGVTSNRTAIGARVRVTAGGITQTQEVSGGGNFCSQESPTVEFGLGAATAITALEIRWPSGLVQMVTPLGVDRRIRVVESAVEMSGFTDVTSCVLGSSAQSVGVNWSDFDLDHVPDLFLTRQGANGLYWARPVERFVDATTAVLAADPALGSAWADIDNDGDLDLFTGNAPGLNHLYRYDLGGVFTDITPAIIAGSGFGYSGAWGDYDRDGLIDLYVANSGAPNQLFRNLGGGNFADVTSPPLDDPDFGISASWGDYDFDGDPDLFLVNNVGVKRLFRNDSPAGFVDVTTGPLSDFGYGRGVTWVDQDNDADLDLFVTSYFGVNRLFRNDGVNGWIDSGDPVLAGTGSSVGPAWGDYDNDGDQDVYITSRGMTNQLLRNDGTSFTDVSVGVLRDPGGGAGAAWADLDSDGDLDLCFATSGGSTVLRNDLANGNHWLEMELTGTVSNRAAIGARVTLVANGVTQVRDMSGGSGYCSQNSLVVHFGLGGAGSITSLAIDWPSGLHQSVIPLSVDRKLYVVEGLAEASVSQPEIGSTFLLASPNPNPASGATLLRLDLPAPAAVRADIVDVAGRVRRSLERGAASTAGVHELRWDGRDDQGRPVNAGVYFYLVEVAGQRQSRRLVIVR